MHADCWGCRLLLAVLLVCAPSWAAAAPPETLRLRLEWGGGAARLWQGRIAVSEGQITDPAALGLEADEVGSMWLERGRPEIASVRNDRGPSRASVKAADGYLVIRQRSSRSYDGVDLSVAAPLEASLFVELSAADDTRSPAWMEIRVADLAHGSFNTEVDDRSNRLVVRRGPGDGLRVRLLRHSLVYWPGETFKCELQPYLLPAEPGTKMKVRAELRGARGGQELSALTYDVVAGQSPALPLEIPLPSQEGAYDIVITASPTGRGSWAHAVRRQGAKPPLAERSIQVMVVAPQTAARGSATDQRLSVVQEIDPAKPNWWAKLPNLPQFSRLRLGKGPLGNGNSRTLSHPLGQLIQLAPNSQPNDASWEAYVLPIHRPGEPHVLEIDYPSDIPQTLGISVIERNVSGGATTAGADSGMELSEDVVGLRSPATWLRHRLVFWPRTTAPLVLLTNRREQAPAVYGKIRVLAGWQHLPRAFPADDAKPGRLLAGYMNRPVFPENFSASEALATSSDSSADWVTFYEGATRLVEYLNHVGYNGLMLSVLADGSAIYPSAILESTPRYDTGTFFFTGQDPVRKDVLEMLLRVFDREGLQLVPAIEFASPLPELEAVLRRGGPEAVGIEWIGPDGSSWTQSRGGYRGRAPYYNVLHPRVQDAMLAVVRELASTYGSHPSFAGLSLQLSAHGYAQSLGPAWGVDDHTVARFARDAKVHVPGEGPDRFLKRARFLNDEGRKQWLEWRAAEVGRFYRRVQAELTAVRKGAPLYLSATDLFSRGDFARDLQPTLQAKSSVAETLLRAGIDASQYAGSEGIVLVRPEPLVFASSLARQAVCLAMQQLPDVDRCFQSLPVPASLFFHEREEVRIRSFEEKCPFKPCQQFFAPQYVPSDRQNRRRLVHSLASMDAQAVFDGGWMLPMGQEDSVRDLVSVFRQLPPVRMELVGDHVSPAAGQPVTIRYGTWGDRTYAYLASDAPFSTAVRVRVDTPPGCRLDLLSPSRSPSPLRRDENGTYWEMELGPYDLVAARFSTPGVRLYSPLVVWPDEVRTVLERRLSDLGYRAAALRNAQPLAIPKNAGFDQPAVEPGQIPGWIAIAPPGVKIEVDRNDPHSGPQSLHLASTGPAGTLVSQPFAPPATGRLTLSVWLRTTAAERQPTLSVAVEGKMTGWTLHRTVEIGQAGGPNPAHPVPAEWGQFLIPFNDLPSDSLSLVHVRFDLTGPGDVWIDDVELCDLYFNPREHKELFKLITSADVQLQNGQIGDCIRLLEGYWPRFLMEHVPVANASASRTPEPAPKSPQESERSAGLLDRLKNLVPQRLRL